MTAAAAFQVVVETLERIGVPYFVVGSLASSFHGIYRSTADIDFVAAVERVNIPALVEALGGEFYADGDLIAEALERNRAFNLIHIASGSKFDIFPLRDEPYARAQFARRQTAELGCRFYVASAEDTILSKLVWFRSGGEVSERQWNDVRGIVAIQQEHLDRNYLRQWAAHLRVADLLDRVLD